jgi:hypothetical protein
MQNKEQKIVIDGVTFQVAPFMAAEGFSLIHRLSRTFGPSLGEILGGALTTKNGSIGDINLGSAAIARGLEKLFEQLGEKEYVELSKLLLSNVIAIWPESGKSRSISFAQDFDTAMQAVFLGKLLSVYQLILFVLKVNYPDFFDKVVSGIGRRIRTTLTSETEETTPQNESEQSETSES